jgi:ribosomal protein S18 acetylase RimI-like enzyme
VSGVEIRPATAGDLPGVLELWRSAGSVPTVSDDLASLERLVGHGGDALIVAVLGQRVVGSLIAGWDGWRGTMYRLAVEPGLRRRGIATALVAEGERRLAAKGAPRAGAIVLHEEVAAAGFWARYGYTLDPRVGRFVRNLPG